MKTVLFARVSSREQEETGYSLPSQEKLLKEYAERKDFRIAKKFSISESASGKSQREIFNEMMEYVKKNNIKIIICEKVDRLTRNFKDAVMIDEWLEKDEERQVHLVKDSLILHKNSRSQEKLNWGIRILFAKNYIDNLSEEVKKGQKEKITQGWLPTKPPLGYKTIGEKGHKIHIIDEEKAPLVRKMFELYAMGNYSLKKLAQVMYEEGLRTRGGNKLVKSRLHELLTDPFYYGKIRWNGEICDGKQEPLITKELFDKVQEILKGKTTPKYNKHFYLFKGLIRCAECEGRITWEKQKGIIYGHCNHYRNCSQKTWVKEPEVETRLLKVFSSLQIKNTRIVEWIRKALKESHKDEIEYHTTALNELKQKYEQIQKRLDKLYDDKLDEKISKEFYERKFRAYSEEKEIVLQGIQKHSQASDKYFELGINIYELSQQAKEIYQKAIQEEKRQLISLVFNNLLLNKGELSFSYTKPFEILSDAVKVTNGSKVLNLVKSPAKIFEPTNLRTKSVKNRAFDPAFAPLLPGWDSNRQPIPPFIKKNY
jgi:DNA invertase Pin-like site-specific DNA recombinase